MTITNTIVLSHKTEQRILELKFAADRRINPVDEVETLVKTMLSSPFFSEETAVKIQEWFDIFKADYMPDIHTNTGGEKAAWPLAYLLVTAIYPEICTDVDNRQKGDFLLDLEDKIYEILSVILPADIKPCELVESCKKNINDPNGIYDETTLESALTNIQNLFQQKISELYNTANEHNLRNNQSFQALKSKLLEFYRQRQVISKDLGDQMDSLSSKLDRVIGLFNEAASEIDQTNKGLDVHNKVFKLFIEESKETIKRLQV